MTDLEFNRYKEALEIKDKIEATQKYLDYLASIENTGYPRTESNWGLDFNLNNDYRRLELTSELFWQCFDFVKHVKQTELDKYKEDFDKL